MHECHSPRMGSMVNAWVPWSTLAVAMLAEFDELKTCRLSNQVLGMLMLRVSMAPK